MSIDTGIVQVPNVNRHGFIGNITEYNDTTPSELVVFPSETRQILVVEPKTMLVITGYNLLNDTVVKFKKILRSNGIPAQGSAGCCPKITIAHSIRLHSAEIGCWKLDTCNPVFVIKTPGSYELEVVGHALDIIVTAMRFDLQEVNDFGHCNDCGG